MVDILKMFFVDKPPEKAKRELETEINKKMTRSIRRLILKYGILKPDSRFIAEVYIAGAADALTTLKGKNGKN